jgi:hypothetical protein
LRSAGASLRRLLSVPWYRRLLQCASSNPNANLDPHSNS